MPLICGHKDMANTINICKHSNTGDHQFKTWILDRNTGSGLGFGFKYVFLLFYWKSKK